MAPFIIEALSKYGPIVALLFQARVMSRFLDARNRDYPLAILFIVLLFILTAAARLFDTLSYLIPHDSSTSARRIFVLWYYAGELLMHILLVVLMLQLIRKTLQFLEQNTRIIYHLAAVSVVVAVCAYFWFGGRFSPRTMLQTRQAVSFWMVLLNLYWWTLLLRKRQLDRRVLLLSAGIGLQMTGQVIGDGIGALAGSKEVWISILSAVVMYATHFAYLYTWFNAFHPSYAVNEASRISLTGTSTNR